ncbi:MAG: glycoside hydrolase family 13 protein [Cyclobacteriaceae bacterium]
MTRSIRVSIFFLFVVAVYPSLYAQRNQQHFQKVEPAFWWVGMKNPELQILLYNATQEISSYKPSLDYAGVAIKEVVRTENPHYLFLTLQIGAEAKAGTLPIQFLVGKKQITLNYELKTKLQATNRIQGFNSSDVMYLIMPDRFANGDIKNDTLPGFYQGVHRDKPFGRHGGDLKGVSDHLDYIKDLGVTAIWLNPVLENNQKRESYHGYAITDLYKVDQRFGSNEEYLNFINKSHGLGLKVIQDMVINHIGNMNWLVRDLPSKDWVHQFPTYTSSNYRSPVLTDPYRSNIDQKLMSDGWFDTTMADVNQQNPLFAKYLIQNSIWWIEHAGIDGIRMDTYPYPDKDFMARYCKEIVNEYPQFSLVGEVWISTVVGTAYWGKDVVNRDGYQSNLPSLTDFPFYFAVAKAFSEQGGWDSGLTRLYDILGQDFAYANPQSNLIFLDNHDLPRFYHMVGKDLNKQKMAWVFLMTTRGTPQLYYGTEILEDGDYSIHPTVRRDFPGGWSGDAINIFANKGVTKDQTEATEFLKKLLQWRKNKSVIHSGKLKHYIPKDNVYVYFRTSEKEKVMVVLNGNAEAKKLDIKRYEESLGGNVKAKNSLTGEMITDLSQFSFPAYSAIILELE